MLEASITSLSSWVFCQRMTVAMSRPPHLHGGHHERAMDLARLAIERSRSKRRGKYEAYARITLGRAMEATGKKQDALNELPAAAALADRLGNPALHVVAAAALLAANPTTP